MSKFQHFTLKNKSLKADNIHVFKEQQEVEAGLPRQVTPTFIPTTGIPIGSELRSRYFWIQQAKAYIFHATFLKKSQNSKMQS